MTLTNWWRRFALGAISLVLASQLTCRSMVHAETLKEGDDDVADDPIVTTNDAQKTALTQLVIPNRVAARRLKSLKQFVDDKNFSAAADALNQLGQEQHSDSLFWNEQGKLVSTFREARAEFSKGGAKAAEAFEMRFGAEARNALQDVERSRDYGALAEVGRRYFFTTAGFTALEQHGTILLDGGHPAEAAHVWRELVRSPAHRSRITSRLIAKTAAALKKAGLETEALEFLSQSRKSLELSDADWLAIQTRLRSISRSTNLPAEDWLTGFGDASNSAVATGSVPFLQARWTHHLEGAHPTSVDEHWQERLRGWERSLADQEGEAIGIATLPIVVGEQVIVRDFRGIIGLSLRAGGVGWRYRAPKSAFEVWSQLEQHHDSDEVLRLGFTSNAAHGLIASDGIRVFAVNLLGLKVPEVPAPDDDSAIGRRQAFQPDVTPKWRNQLVCLRVPDAGQFDRQREITVDAEWKVGADSGRSGDRLAEHIFLGPPLPVGESVYAITEEKGELNLVRVQAATGQVLRVTRLCAMNGNQSAIDGEHSTLNGFIPAAASGIVVCPTEAGVLVAVDALFGEIQWIYPYLPPSVQRQRNVDTQWVDGPHIWQDSIVYLPRQGGVVHCVDLQTGLRRWANNREDAKYVGAVTDEVVVLIGAEQARGLHRKTGKTLWTTKLGAISGRGVAIGSKYVVPLKSGGVANVDMATGRLDRFERSLTAQTQTSVTNDDVRPDVADDLRQFGLAPLGISAEVRPGNLIAHRDTVISLGPCYLTMFSQAHARQRELAGSTSATDQLLLADVELTLNDLDAAEARLLNLSTVPESRELSRSLLRATHRELTLAKLNRSDPQRKPTEMVGLIEQLQELSRSPAERAQAMAWRVHSGLLSNAMLSVGVSSRELAQSGRDEFVAPRDRDDYVVRSSALARRGMRHALTAKDGLERRRLMQFLQADFDDALRDGSLAALLRFVDLYAGTLEAHVIRNRVVDRLIAASQLHEAESHLLANSQGDDREQRAMSGLLMVCLLASADLPGEAARSLEQVVRDGGDVDLTNLMTQKWKSLDEWFDLKVLRSRGPLTVAGCASALRADTRLAEIYRQRQPLEWPVAAVRINERGPQFAKPVLNELFHQTRRLELSSGLDTDVFTRYTDGEQFWCLSDRVLGVERGRVHLPTQLDIDFRNFGRQPGHLVSAGSVGHLNGVSLLDVALTEPFWKLRYPPAEARGELIETGPATGRTSFFYSRRHLFAVDSATGRVRWRRSDIGLPVGLAGDMRQHIFADEEGITVFQADGITFTTLTTETGEIIRAGQADFDQNFAHPKPLGRKLAVISRVLNENGARRFRIWDPLTNKDDVDEVFHSDDPQPQETKDGRVVLLKRTGQLRVFAPGLSGPELEVQVPLEPKETNSTPSLFVDGHFAYLNLRRDQPSFQGRRYVQIQDAGIPNEPLTYGSLLAIDRHSQQVLWKRETRTRIVLRIEAARLPFLITAVLVQPDGTGGEQSLELEVIDRLSGTVLGQSRSLIPCRLVHAEFERHGGRLSLYGLMRRKQTDAERWQTTFGTVNRIDLEFLPPNRSFAWRRYGWRDVNGK